MPLSISPQFAPKHKDKESPKGTFSDLKENLGNTFLVWLVLKKVGLISYELAKEALPSIIDL